MKYKNKDGIELNYTQRNNVQTDLVKEVVGEAIRILEGGDDGRQFPHVTCNKAIKFLKENFDIIEVKDLVEGFNENV